MYHFAKMSIIRGRGEFPLTRATTETRGVSKLSVSSERGDAEKAQEGPYQKFCRAIHTDPRTAAMTAQNSGVAIVGCGFPTDCVSDEQDGVGGDPGSSDKPADLQAIGSR